MNTTTTKPPTAKDIKAFVAAWHGLPPAVMNRKRGPEREAWARFEAIRLMWLHACCPSFQSIAEVFGVSSLAVSHGIKQVSARLLTDRKYAAKYAEMAKAFGEARE